MFLLLVFFMFSIIIAVIIITIIMIIALTDIIISTYCDGVSDIRKKQNRGYEWVPLWKHLQWSSTIVVCKRFDTNIVKWRT